METLNSVPKMMFRKLLVQNKYGASDELLGNTCIGYSKPYIFYIWWSELKEKVMYIQNKGTLHIIFHSIFEYLEYQICNHSQWDNLKEKLLIWN